MKSIKQHIAFAILFIFLLSACSSSRKADQSSLPSAGVWQLNPLTIDGNDSDWVGNLPFYDEKEGVSYSVTSDKANLYVLLRTTTDHTQQQILRGGLTVLFNAHGVKDEHGAAGISYPTGNRHQKDNVLGSRQDLNNNKNALINDAKDYSLFGFNTVKTVENYDYGKANAEGIEVSIGLTASGALVYEAMVPFTALFNQSGAVNAGGKDIAVGLIIDDIPGEQGQRGGSRGSGLSFGGGFGLGSFGSAGGMGLSIGTGALGGGNRQRGAVMKQIKIWKEVTLARTPAKK